MGPQSSCPARYMASAVEASSTTTHSVHIGLAGAEVVRVALEDRLHIRLVALQHEGTGADGALRLLQVAEVVHHFWGDDPHARRLRQHVEEPDIGLTQEELHGQ